MYRVALVHWDPAEARERVARLRAAGYDAVHAVLDAPAALRKLRVNPPAAVVIDLTRLPSHGRDVALSLRLSKGTRHVPLIFVNGDPEKVARIRGLLPDAVYTTWGRIAGALRRAIAHPPADPVVQRSLLAGYSGTPLPRKLGIKVNSAVTLIDAPPGFERTLGSLPEGVTVRRRPARGSDLIVWFVKSRANLERRLDGVARTLADRGGLWIAWPKKASGMVTDLSQTEVRRVGLAAGLVDYKICAIDATWSALQFTRRRS